MIDLEAEWERVRTTPSDIVDHLPYMHDLAVDMNAQRIIELGVRHGTSTIAWLHALQQTGGHLWSVDINQAPGCLADVNDSSRAPLVWPPRTWDLTICAEHGDRWTFVQGDDMRRRVRDAMPLGADIVFIDTDHLYEHTLAELEAYGAHTRAGGVMVLHDTELEYSPFDRARRVRYPVRRAIEEYVGDLTDRVEWRTGCYGLAVIHV